MIQKKEPLKFRGQIVLFSDCLAAREIKTPIGAGFKEFYVTKNIKLGDNPKAPEVYLMRVASALGGGTLLFRLIQGHKVFRDN